MPIDAKKMAELWYPALVFKQKFIYLIYYCSMNNYNFWSENLLYTILCKNRNNLELPLKLKIIQLKIYIINWKIDIRYHIYTDNKLGIKYHNEQVYKNRDILENNILIINFKKII